MESNERLNRKLAAIFFADVVGYSRLTNEDEDGAYRQVRACLDLISNAIRSHNGTVVNFAGDAVLADFPTASEAVTCAAQVQQALKNKNAALPEDTKVRFRIGINLGEVIVDRDDIYGDGVNVAARLEGLAEPGGICISQAVHAAIGSKLDLSYQDIGLQQVKNIAKPVHAYQVLQKGEAQPARPRVARHRTAALITGGLALFLVLLGVAWQAFERPGEKTGSEDALAVLEDGKPSIAVLPFKNVGGETKKDYFSDGITNGLITDLSRFSNLFVIASNSVFTYKGKAVDIKNVGRDLGVRYAFL